MRVMTGLILVAAFGLVGCASIPLSTAFHLASMSPRDIAQVDPAQVRVRISLPEGFQLDIPKSRLSLTITTDSGKVSKAMALSLLSVTQEVRSGGMFQPDVSVSTYLLALTPAGVEKLRALQQLLLAGDAKGFEFYVGGPLAKIPAGAREVTFWAALKLSKGKSFMPLIDGAELKLSRGTSGS